MSADYAHKQRNYPKARDQRQRPLHHPTTEQIEGEVNIRRAFRGAYQTLADTFRSEVFAAGFPRHNLGEAITYVNRFIDDTRTRAVDLFTDVLVPVAYHGSALGQREASKGWFRRRFRKAQSATASLPFLPSTPAATVNPLYPGSYPKQVPPRRRLLRIPPPKIVIPPSARNLPFSGAPQVHLDAVAQLPVDLVQLIDDSQREGIKTVLDEAIRRGYDPDMIGMQIANMVGLFPRWQQAVINVGNRMAEQGRPQREIDYRMNRYSDWLRERRGIMIARTELMTALNAGRMAGWKEQEESGLLDTKRSGKEWLSAPGACPICEAMNGRIVVGTDSAFELPDGSAVQAGPAHPHCRCTVLVHPVRNPEQYLEPV